MKVMSSKKLIEHTRSILLNNELAHLGFHMQDNKGMLNGNNDNSCPKRDLTLPIIVSEDDILEKYLTDNNITASNDRIFLTETFLGCIRHQKMLESSLRLFYKKTGGNYLQTEYHLFSVLFYLALWRLEELGFQKFSKFVRLFDPLKMSKLLGFIFNPANLNHDLKIVWEEVLDHQFLKEHVIDPVLRHVSIAQSLMEELRNLADNGMVAKKSQKTPTEPREFILTIPKIRKPVLPTPKMSVVVKAIPVPKTLYKESSEMVQLLQIKESNRTKLQKQYEINQKGIFKVATRKPSDKVKKIRQELEQEQKEKIDRERAKLHRPVPRLVHEPVQVKLTTAAILREDALIRKQRQKEEAEMIQAETMIQDPKEFEKWKEECKLKEMENRLLELERRRLDIQLVHEDIYVARQEIVKENRDKAIEVHALKEEIKSISDQQKRLKDEENKKKIEDVHEIKLGIIRAKTRVIEDNTKIASEIAHAHQILLQKARREEEEEHARKTELIQQIRLVERSIPPVGSIQRGIDLTETSGIGLLGEMSIVELQERLLLAKIRVQDDEECRRSEITKNKMNRLEQISHKLQEIDNERSERKSRRVQKSLPDRGLSVSSMATDRSTTKSIKMALFEKDPELRILQEKIAERKAARLSSRCVIETSTSIHHSLAKHPSTTWNKRSTPSSNTRSDTSMPEKCDDLDKVEILSQTQHTSERQESDSDGLLWQDNVQNMDISPTVELKTMQI
ncbi:hypothetical protein BASA84_000088 [Batrachochytrium salamandrivorans]|nr:hypothetical protein BASA84_000088 [Batrachochytrium salamandrivorans]